MVSTMNNKYLNLDGFQAPQSVILITKTLEQIEQGGTLEIVIRDKEIINALPRLSEDTSWKVVEISHEHRLVHYTIKKN